VTDRKKWKDIHCSTVQSPLRALEPMEGGGGGEEEEEEGGGEGE